MGETCDTWRGKDMLLLLVCSIAGVEGLATVGNLPTLHHDVAGTVLAVTNTNLLIKDFIYDGTAPDAFFWVGTEGAPGSVVEGPDGATWNHTAILAHPFSGQHYLYTDTDYPVLTRIQGEDILLTLPPTMQVSDIRWISVWCKAFAIDFGSVMFPEDLLVESEVEETTTKDEMENGDDDLDEEVENYEEDDLDDEVENNEVDDLDEEAENHEEDTFIGMNIISSVQNAIETIQGWLSFV